MSKHQLNVLQVNKLYYPYIGGVETVVQLIAEGLKDEFNLKVLACQAFGLGRSETINGVPVVRSGAITPFWSVPLSPGFPFAFARLAREADIIHLHSPFPPGELFYSWLVKPLGKKLVVSWHSDIFRQRWLKPLYGRLVENVLASADRIIVATPNHISSSPQLSRYRDKCRVIPFGIDPRRFDLDGTERAEVDALRQRHGDFVLFAGRLSYYKGLEYLIRAMARVDGRLVVIGDGVLREKMEKLAAELGLGGRVVFLGRLSERELKLYFNACSVFCLPSIYNTEAFGLVQLEAMACGKPVVNTNLPTGVTYVSRDGETGLSVPPADPEALAAALSELLYNNRKRELFGRQARERVARTFTLEKMLKDIGDLYLSLDKGR